MTIVELPPFLVASPVYFPPFVKGDNVPEGLLRIYNNGPARWRGSIVANVPWINVPDTTFVCEPGYSVEVYVALNSKALDVLQPGLSRWDDTLAVTGGREPVTASVQVDLRKEITEIHLDTPTLNFGQVDGAAAELPSQMVRLVNASPAPWNGQVELCVPWLSVQSASRTFNLEVPGQSVAEFSVALNEAARRSAPGMVAEDRAVRITGQGGRKRRCMDIRALFVLNEWSPLLSAVAGQSPAERRCAAAGHGAQYRQPGMVVPGERRALARRDPRDRSRCEPGQEQVIEIKRKPPRWNLRPPCAIRAPS